jgi:hypothetical protein
MTLPDFPKVELTLDSVEKFTVTNPHHKILWHSRESRMQKAWILTLWKKLSGW